MDDVVSIRRPHRRRKTPMEIFKEAYLPYLILLCAIILIICFLFGAVSRAADEEKASERAAISIDVYREV